MTLELVGGADHGHAAASQGIGMVNPGFLKNESVIEWLGGVEPYWTYLEFDSYCRLRSGPDEDGRALRLASDMAATEVRASPMIAATLHLLSMAEAQPVKLTPSGCLARATVVELAQIVDGPAFDLSLIRSVTKVLE